MTALPGELATGITAAWLEGQRACHAQMEIFRATFGESAPPTREAVAKAVEAGLSLGWLAMRVLDGATLDVFGGGCAAALAAYRRDTAGAWAAYERRRHDAWADYDRAKAAKAEECRRLGVSLAAEYELARVAAWAEYERVRDAAWAEYKRRDLPAAAAYRLALASAFADAIGLA